MKKKLASVLVSLALGWLTTAAIAEEEVAVSADTSATTSEPAAVTDEATEPAAMDTSTTDGTISASPTESEAK